MDKMINDIFSRNNVVIITGAGISTLSGIPDFRGKNGLYTKNEGVEEKLSRSYFLDHPDEFYDFYKENMIMHDVEPNVVHETLAKLEQIGYIKGIITQNIDNLHQRAGSKNVIDIHGNGDKFYCTSCKTEYSTDDYLNKGYKCTCIGCQGIIRPDIVLYEEQLDYEKFVKAYNMINHADTVVVLGSSLTVSTVQNLLNSFLCTDGNDKKLYIFNNQKTPYDNYGMRYDGDLGEVFEEIKMIYFEKDK